MDNKIFCYAPWMHLYTNPDSTLMPCCLFHDKNEQFPKLNSVPLDEAINHPRMIEIRKELIDGKIPAGCYRCEAQSKMKMATPYYAKMLKYTKEENIGINEDGTLRLEDYNPTFLDIRFGNLCNLKCRTCSPVFSSSIAVEFNKIHNANLQVLYSLNNDVIQRIMDNLDKVEHIYIAGGEPLIEENNYVLLNTLIERNLKPSLLYSTNLTNIQFKDNNIIDLWKHFPEVTLTVSLDGYKKVNDYIRFGSSYEQIMENIATIKRDAPHVRFSINSVASLMSMHSLPDLGKDLLEHDICDPKDIMFSICHYPEELDPAVLSREAKDKVVEKFTHYIEWLRTSGSQYQIALRKSLIENYLGILDYMMSKDNSHLFPEAIDKLTRQDEFRKTDYTKVLTL